MSRAIFILIAIIIVIVVAVFAIGGVLAYQYYWQAPEEEILKETPADETADWQTYRNEKYGFEIKYPNGLEAKEKEQSKYVEIGLVLVNFSIKIKENVSSLEELKKSEENELIDLFGGITVDVSDLKISWKDITFLGLEAKELNFKALAGGEPMVWRTYIIKNNTAYIFSSGNSDSSRQYYKILSTFRFID